MRVRERKWDRREAGEKEKREKDIVLVSVFNVFLGK